ncbi:glycosyltransferase family 2 protein [Candidatus Uhrbacteria bacterium]|nr:glycosyltransferase family 2 protein [Candidatus Uhrbacteria bacterium]
MNGLVSVVIPTYQHAGTIGACLDSVFAQTYSPIEVIVVNDGSTDATQEVLAPYRDRATVITQENRGGNPARNRGLAAANGEFVIFCDADVIMRPDMIERMVAALAAHPDASIAYSGFRFGWKRFRGVPWNPARLRKVNYIHTTSLVRRDAFPGFDEAIKRFQDWDVWLTMLAQGKSGVLVPGTLFRCLIDGESRTGSRWLPSFMYRIPWEWLPWRPHQVAKYEAARAVMVAKHKL